MSSASSRQTALALSSRVRRPLGPTFFLILSSIVVVAPLLLAVFTAFRPMSEGNVHPWLPPIHPTLRNFVLAWVDGRFGMYFKNSLIISTIDALLMLVVALPASYVFAFLRFPGRQAVFSIFLLGLIIPPIAILLPLFTTILKLGLYNTRFGVVLCDVSLALPVFLFINRAFLVSIPGELRDSAQIDGCGELRILTRIMAPIARPVILTTILLEFMWSWNDLLLRLVFLTRDELRTMALGLLYFQGRYTQNIQAQTAAAIIMAAPIVVMFLFFRREFIIGLTSGSLKA